MQTKAIRNDLNRIFTAMRHGEYIPVIDTKDKMHIGLINGILREDGSGKNWIVTITAGLKSNKVFIHAN